MDTSSLANQGPVDWNSFYTYVIRQATTAVTKARNLNEALEMILDACCDGFGFLHPSFVLLDQHEDRIVGRLISLPHSRESILRAAKGANVFIDGLLGPRQDRRSAARRPLGDADVPPDTVAFKSNMTDNLVVRVFLERDLQITSCYYDLVRPFLRKEDAQAVQEALGIHSFVLLPVLTSEQCFGVFIVASSSVRQITDALVVSLGLFATQAAVAVDKASLQHDLYEREQQVSLLLKATIDAQEEERERICMEIHDGVAQTLAPAFHYLQTLDSTTVLPEELRTSVRKAGALVKNAIREAREIISSLRPAALDTLGLIATLRYEMDELRQQANWHLEFEADNVRFPKAVETALYRIIREAANNITKHARATHVRIRIKQVEEYIVVEVQDNGIGFDLASLERDARRKGVGLPSMRKRAELLSGRFFLNANQGRGTLVRVEVPLFPHIEQDENASERSPFWSPRRPSANHSD